MHHGLAVFLQENWKKKENNNSARQHWFVFLCLPAAFSASTSRIALKAVWYGHHVWIKWESKACQIHLKAFHLPLIITWSQKTTQFSAFPPWQASKRSKALESFQQVCSLFLCWRGCRQFTFYSPCSKSKREAQHNNSHRNVFVKLTAVSF